MDMIALEVVYANAPEGAVPPEHRADHRRRVLAALAPTEPIHFYFWDADVSGLLLFTDRRILQFPRLQVRRGLFSFTYRFETQEYPYSVILRVETARPTFFEFARLILHCRDRAVCIGLTRIDPQAHEAMAATLRQLVTAWQDSSPPEPDQVTGPLADRLKALDDLLESGALDETEYRQARRRLLGLFNNRTGSKLEREGKPRAGE
ncbi:MAG: SHOCT domain-containing protein [Anaerolineae bacterium]|nr:SHOCT domain-containing protein [Anaerolineae bacterium]